MNKQNFKLFPVLVNKYSNFLTPKQVDSIKDYCLQRPTTVHNTIENNGTSNHSLDSNFIEELLENVSDCKDLDVKIQNTLDDYADEFGMFTVRLSNSWFNIQQPGSVLRQHIHPHSIISGALYISANLNSSKIYFENPNRTVHYFSNFNKPTEYNFEYFNFQPEAGSLILFPSWLFHGSNNTKNFSDNRIVISFNTIAEG